MANLFRKLCTKFRQNRPSFKGDIVKKTWSLFSGHNVFVADSDVNLTSTTLTLLAPKATDFDEITRNNGHYVTEGHSRS